MAKNQLSHDKVIEVSTHIGAYLIRTRHIQNKKISNDEINLVLQSITDFININFENQFTSEEFISIKENTLKLLKRAEFDQELVAELQAHVKGQLAPYEYPKEIEFIDQLPMTTTGKVQRRVLRVQEEERAARPPGG